MFFTTITIKLTTIDKQSVPKRIARITPNASLRKLKIASMINMVFPPFLIVYFFWQLQKQLPWAITTQRLCPAGYKPQFLENSSLQNWVYFVNDEKTFLFFTIGEKIGNVKNNDIFSDFSSVYMNNRIRLHKKSKMITKNRIERKDTIS